MNICIKKIIFDLIVKEYPRLSISLTVFLNEVQTD